MDKTMEEIPLKQPTPSHFLPGEPLNSGISAMKTESKRLTQKFAKKRIAVKCCGRYCNKIATRTDGHIVSHTAPGIWARRGSQCM